MTVAFHEDLVEGLPDPARRYFRHAIEPGIRLAASVRLRMKGSIRVSPKKPWAALTAVEDLTPASFVWKSSVRFGLISLRGADSYREGSGSMRFRLLGLLPVVAASGPDVTRSARGRLAGERIWLPSSLLPQSGVRWEPVDEESARFIVTIDGEPIPVTLCCASDGRLRSITLERWGDQTEDRSFAPIPFVCHSEAEAQFGGYRIPAEVRGGWWSGTKRYFEFFRFTIESAEFR